MLICSYFLVDDGSSEISCIITVDEIREIRNSTRTFQEELVAVNVTDMFDQMSQKEKAVCVYSRF